MSTIKRTNFIDHKNQYNFNLSSRRKLKTPYSDMKHPTLIKKISTAIIWPLLLCVILHFAASLNHYNLQVTSSSCSDSLQTSSMINSRSPSETKRTCNQYKSIFSTFLQSVSSNSHYYLSENIPSGRSVFGGKILFAHAMQQEQSFKPNHHTHDGIIELNSTNFNSELIQHNHPFPHIKLIEYYVSFCRFCTKFKQSYIDLAKEIHGWRNVLRPSAIDVSVSSNSPIAHSWSVETVPTLRIHPPPKPSLASKLDKQLSTWHKTLSFSDLQKSMFNEYNSSNLMLHSLAGVTQYLEKVSLLKLDLLRYIERYVANTTQKHNDNNNEDPLFPVTWPNLRPVTESSLIELLRNHPRPELFLIIEGRPSTSVSDQSSSTSQQQRLENSEPSLGLQILMELSSSAPWKAVRYVRASENKELIEDVLVQHKRAIVGSDRSSGQILEQVELLNNLLLTTKNGEGTNTIVLVHIDDSHTTVNSVNSGTSSSSSSSSSSSKQASAAQPSAFPFMNIVSAIDLGGMATMLDHDSNTHHQNQNKGYSLISRAKRASTTVGINQSLKGARKRRSLFSVAGNSMLDKMSSERKVELLSKYIKQTYSETSEDREFVRAINRFDSESDINKSSDETLSIDNKQEKPSYNTINDDNTRKPLTSIFYSERQVASSKNQFDCSPDYGDKLKAIRYMLFNEIPRSTEPSSLVEQQERLNTLVNLITIIKSYFPLPDSASIQFIDGVQSYLTKQQSMLLHVINGSQQGTSDIFVKGFDVKAFKQELKRLESVEKKLPEIKQYKQCSGYPCAVWRLFHTLTAFEYKKLSQIRQPSRTVVAVSSQQQHHELHALNDSQSLSSQASLENPTIGVAAPIVSSGSSNDQTPVERLISPPSTTTSLSLTIATPTSFTSQQSTSTLDNSGSGNNNKPLTEADLPTPVILVMRDYITTYFSCDECRKNFKLEASDLSLEKIRREPADFSIMWLWETHNRVNKRLSVDPSTNPPERPKIWFPSYQQCETCYIKPPTFLRDLSSTKTTTTSSNTALGSSPAVTSATTDPTIFHEAIEWNRQKVLAYLVATYTRHPMDNYANIFGYNVPYWSFIIATCICGLILGLLLRCTSCYIERQRRHKATLLNGNGAHYSIELQ